MDPIVAAEVDALRRRAILEVAAGWIAFILSTVTVLAVFRGPRDGFALGFAYIGLFVAYAVIAAIVIERRIPNPFARKKASPMARWREVRGPRAGRRSGTTLAARMALGFVEGLILTGYGHQDPILALSTVFFLHLIVTTAFLALKPVRFLFFPDLADAMEVARPPAAVVNRLSRT